MAGSVGELMSGDPYNSAPLKPSKPDPWAQVPVKKDRTRNPTATVIYAQRKHTRGEMLWYDGKKFTNNHSPKYFGTRERAKGVARILSRKYPVLRNFNLYVGSPNKSVLRARRKNPSWPDEQSQLDEAARRLEDFSGHGVRRVLKMRPRSNRNTGLVVGELDLLGYQVRREGVDGGKMVRYEHDFAKRSRPLLAVSSDGNQLHIVGGRYEFTEAGIEDR